MKKFLKYFFLVIIALILIFFSLGIIKPAEEYSFSITVNAPVEKTFEIFNDTTRIREWLTDLQKIENISGNANEAGSKWRLVFHDHGKEIVMTETIKAFEKNKLFAFNIENDFIVSHNDIRFEGKGNQTEIKVNVNYKGGNMFSKSLFVLYNSTMKKMHTESFYLFKKSVEQSNAS